jgi:cytochrome c551/c552
MKMPNPILAYSAIYIDPRQQDSQLQEREYPSDRKPWKKIIMEGQFRK